MAKSENEQNEVFTITECGVYGDLITVSSFAVAKQTAEQIKQFIWADKNLVWVDDWQLADRMGGRVYLRIVSYKIDNPSSLVYFLAGVKKEGWINSATGKYENV